MKTYSIPPQLETWINSSLQTLGSSLSHSKPLAQSIKRMSDFYLESPEGQTPWSETWCQEAQLAYYFPLNFLRNVRVFDELRRQIFFDHPFHWNEFGVGLGPSLEAYLTTHPQQSFLKSTQLNERSKPARELTDQRFQDQHKIKLNWSTQSPKNLPPQSLVVLSYSLTELASLPEWVWSAQSILILEPSTRDDGRKLMAIRNEALEHGYSISAPCTHSLDCPLLTQSKRDWCHDRFGFDRPKWMLDIESHLPFINPTLTVSYLALKKVAAPKVNVSGKPLIRVVGDFLDEKGKSRQLICRSSKREFLTFLKKATQPPEFFRGDLLQIDEPIVIKGDELRVEPNQIHLEPEDPKISSN